MEWGQFTSPTLRGRSAGGNAAAKPIFGRSTALDFAHQTGQHRVARANRVQRFHSWSRGGQFALLCPVDEERAIAAARDKNPAARDF